MHWVRVVNPQYDQSRRHQGEIGEVVGRWGPENSADGREGYLVEFAGGEIVGVTHDEVAVVDAPDRGHRPLAEDLRDWSGFHDIARSRPTAEDRPPTED